MKKKEKENNTLDIIIGIFLMIVIFVLLFMLLRCYIIMFMNGII